MNALEASSPVDGGHPITPAELHEEAERLDRAAEQGRRHVEVELGGDVEAILGTLASNGPYAYTRHYYVRDNGRLFQPFDRTYEDIREYYYKFRGEQKLLDYCALSQVSGSWYSFYNLVTTSQTIATEEVAQREALVLFPTMGRSGITGELFWARRPQDVNQPTKRTVADRMTVVTRHERYRNALASGAVDDLVAYFSDDVQYGLRDYMDDDGSVRGLDGREAVGDYFMSFYERFHVERVSLLQRHAGDWYVFAEYEWVVTDQQDGTVKSFRTAEYVDVENDDGSCQGRISHGTDVNILASVPAR